MRNGWGDRPVLWQLLKDKGATDWNVVIERLNERPEEARWRRTQHGRSGRMFLHYVLEYLQPPITVVQKLIEVCPYALRHTNVHGNLPLHEAANVSHDHSADVVRTIFQAYPEAVLVKNIRGDAPIHTLLSWGPFANSESRARKLLSASNVDNVIVLLRSPFFKADGSQLKYAICDLNEPWEIICALWQRDDIDDCNLYLRRVTDVVLKARFVARYGHLVPYLELHALAQEENKVFGMNKLQQYYVQEYGYQARMLDFRLRLCLNYVIEQGYCWDIVRKVYDLAVKALETRDIISRMYPFMTAAVRDTNELSVVFELLRQKPSIVQLVLDKILLPTSTVNNCKSMKSDFSGRRELLLEENENARMKRRRVIEVQAFI